MPQTRAKSSLARKRKKLGEKEEKENKKLRVEEKSSGKDEEIKDKDNENSESDHSASETKKQELSNCKHLKSIKYETIRKRILTPSLWSCEECSTTDSVWACLTCATVSCGRYAKGHAQKHYATTKHPLVLEINSKLCHCDYVSNDNRFSHIQRLRDCLEKAQTLKENKEDESMEGKEETEETNFQPKKEEFEKLDKLNTFITRWRYLYLSKAFNRWKEFVQEKKEKREKEEAEKETSEPKTPVKPISSRLPKTPRASFGTPMKRSLSGTLIVPGQTGLRNLGNTCFLNSVLQALSYNTEFRDYFIDTLLPRDDKQNSSVTINNQIFVRQATVECLQSLRQKTLPQLDKISVAMQLHQLLRVLWSGKWAVVTPYSLLESVWKFVPKFKNFQQQDAQEFLCYLLDRLHFELTGGHSNETSIVNAIFQGKLESKVICSNCKTESITIDPFLDLQLDIPVVSLARGGRRPNKVPSCTLYECFKSFTAIEELTGKIRMCEKCNSKQDASKRMQISTLPSVLCIVLKRFAWTSKSRAKVNTIVEFPLRELDLSPFTSEKIGQIYDLQSVIMHHGYGLQSGHYTAYCFNSETDTWVHANDSKVSIASEEEVQAAEAYLLFYERKLKKLEITNPFK